MHASAFRNLYEADFLPCSFVVAGPAATNPALVGPGSGQRRHDVVIAPVQLGSVLDQDPGHLAWCHAALQAKQRHPQFDQMIKPVADPIAPPTAELRLAN